MTKRFVGRGLLKMLETSSYVLYRSKTCKGHVTVFLKSDPPSETSDWEKHPEPLSQGFFRDILIDEHKEKKDE